MRFCFAAVVIDVNAFEPEMIFIIVCSYVSTMVERTCSCTLSGLRVVCGCIHGCTLSDVLIALYVCSVYATGGIPPPT